MSRYKKRQITVRFTVEEIAQIDDLCQKLGINRQQYIRNVTLGEIPDITFLNNIGLIPLYRTLKTLKDKL